MGVRITEECLVIAVGKVCGRIADDCVKVIIEPHVSEVRGRFRKGRECRD